MFSLETYESRISTLMETVKEAALTELRRLLEGRAAVSMAAQRGSAPATEGDMKGGEEEREVTAPEERALINEAVTNQFASLMEAWIKGAVEKILLMLKVSMWEAEKGPAAAAEEQTSMKPAAGQVSGPEKQSASRSARQKRKKIKGRPEPAVTKENDHMYHREPVSRRSHQKRKKMEGEPEPAITKENDHLYYKEQQPNEAPTADPAADSESVTEPADAATHECNSESPSEAEAVLTEPASDLREEDVVQGDTGTSTTTSKMKKKTRVPLKCPDCDKSFTLKCMLDRHYLTHSKPHLCSECGKRFSVQRGLIAHSRRHTGEKLHQCSICGTEFGHKSTFERHMRWHRTEKPVTHTCTLCDGQFVGVLAFQRHRCSALKTTFVCSLCPETFGCRQSLADHENQHSGDRDFVCETCGESFFSFSSLATHRVTHMQKENCCDVLGLWRGDSSVLKNHLSKHAGEKLFFCEVCGKGCSHRSALKHHMLTHTGEKPFVCETCGKRCSHASALQNHTRTHTGRKPGKPACDVCGKTFHRTVNLKCHMYVHTGVKLYACDQCEKKYSTPGGLKLHMTVHSGEKMYDCNLKQHERVHAGGKSYWCVVCGKGFIHSSNFHKHRRAHLPDEPRDGQSAVKT